MKSADQRQLDVIAQEDGKAQARLLCMSHDKEYHGSLTTSSDMRAFSGLTTSAFGRSCRLPSENMAMRKGRAYTPVEERFL